MLIEDISQIIEREKQALEKAKRRIHICVAAGCLSAGSQKVLDEFKSVIKKAGMQDVIVKGVGCMGPCAGGPVVMIHPDNILYEKITPENVPEIVESLGNKPVERFQADLNHPFFTRQHKIVLRNCGLIDPERIEEYIANNGYSALIKVLTDMSPSDVIIEVTKSGLRGRGGAGYPTGLKWKTVAKAGGYKKYIVCNADEGDPGAFMDRSVLESDPHSVIEGMIIGAIAVGASQGFIYVRAEYPLAIKRLKRAISQAERMGFLGKRILGSPYDFTLEIRYGAGAYVCGEETALIASIEGKRGAPRPRPPYPAEAGLWGHSTLINNVETFANISTIINNGGEWFSNIGTATSKGTKVFSIVGKITNTGLIEVPIGMTLRDIVFDIGGGIPDNGEFKAVQTGGPSGGCITSEHLDVPVDYENLLKLGSIMGSGGMIVIDNTSNMVDVARYFIDFSVSESCGKCVPCRVGTIHLRDLLDKILSGQAIANDIKTLEELSELLKTTSLCGLGQSAPNPVLSALRYFRNEFEELLKK